MPIDVGQLTTNEKLALCCLYFARLPSDDDRYKGRSKVFELLSKKYNVKKNTLKNNKDRFDALFDNGRRGWHQKPLQQQNRFLFDVFLQYGEVPIEELQTAVEEILREAYRDVYSFYSLKTKDPTVVQGIKGRGQNMEIMGLNWFREELRVGDMIFLVLGGDRSAVSWDTGLIGLATITQGPYDEGYERGNFKIRIDVRLLLEKPIKREDLTTYRDTYDITGIGPMTKWEPNQAISRVSEYQAVALMRAMLELRPNVEQELNAIIPDDLLRRIKGSTVKLVPVEVDLNEELRLGESPWDEEVGDDDEPYSESYSPDVSQIVGDFRLPGDPVNTMVNLLRSGKNVILSGVPGTGKTTLAKRACEEAARTKFIDGYIMTTAVSDWTTFETIGGYMPDKNGCLEFQEGLFLKSIRENKWLVVDEINRAEVDKAFGQFFTVLSGMSVELPFRIMTASGEQSVSIQLVDGPRSYLDERTATYNVGRNWRILGTMNTYDKNTLFSLSYAFMRRFAFVQIHAPTGDGYGEIIDNRLEGKDKNGYIRRVILQLVAVSPKQLGPAIILDLVSLVETSDSTTLVEGICSLVVPQYEGLSINQIKNLYRDLGKVLSAEDRERLRKNLCEFFDVEEKVLDRVKAEDEAQDSTTEVDTIFEVIEDETL